MAALKVELAVPILIYGELDRIQGEVWLTNTSGGDITLDEASLTVDFPTPETGQIPLPASSVIPKGGTRFLAVQTNMPRFTPSGTYPAQITLKTSAGTQTVAATLVIADTFEVALAPASLTFTGVKKSTTLTGTVYVVNRGNTPIKVGTIPAETMLEVVTIPRVVEVSGSTLSVEPGTGTAAGGTVTFTNPTKTVGPGAWAAIDVKLKMPATLTANRHFRVLPRIATQRFVVDLLT